jgi:OmpA-OmpF porin, OOP family
MALNLIDMLKGTLTEGGTLGAISSFLGENESATKSGIGAAIPTLLGSVIQSGSTPSGASALLNMLSSGGHDGGILSNIGGLLGGGSATTGLMNTGGGLLKTFLGDKLGGVVDLISRVSGLKSGSTSSLLSMAAPMLMGLIGKQVGSSGLSGLTSLLTSQASNVTAALPAGMSNLMGFANMGGDAKRVVENVTTEASGGFGKFLPWILGLGLLGGALYWWNNNSAKPAEVVAEAKDKAMDMANDTKAALDTAVVKVGDIFKLAIPGGVSLDVPKGSLEDQLANFIQSADTISKNKWFDFDRLTFETGKATLKPESGAQLANVAAIMKAFPNAKIKIGGYTDNVGNAKANLKLSADRAKNVMAELVKLGTEATRMESEGYGDQHPIAPNDTEEGKAKNRRISISVRAK